MIWNQGVLDFHAFGWGPVVVRRYRDGEQLVWEYADGSVTRMDRICTLRERRESRARGEVLFQRIEKPTGVGASELNVPYFAFTDAGMAVDVAFLAGGWGAA